MEGILISIIFNVLLFLVLIVMIGLLLMIKKHTPALAMYKAKMKGLPLCVFYNDDHTFEMTPLKPDNGIITHPKYGVFVVNEEGSYIDKKNKFVVLSFSSSVGISVPARFAKVTDSLKRLIGDESKMRAFREKLMNGTIEKTTDDMFNKYATDKILADANLDETEKTELLKRLKDEKVGRFDVVRESISYTSIKSMMNSITPQNVNNKINATISRRMGDLLGDGMKYMVILLLAGLGIVGLLGFVLYTYANPSPENLAMAKALAQQSANAGKVVVTNASVLG